MRTSKLFRPIEILVALVMLAVMAGLWRPPAALSQSEAQLAKAVQAKINQDPFINGQSIRVRNIDGVIILSGWSDNLLSAERATLMPETFRGVRAVVNQIRIRPSSRGDDQVRRDILKALSDDQAVDPTSIDVAVRNGEVYMSGSVESWQRGNIYVRTAKSVRGVVKVHNNIGIEPPARRPDGDIVQDIRERLRWNIWLDDAKFKLDVSQGDVTLVGSVGSAFERRQAIEQCWVVGVTSVDGSQLTVQSRTGREATPGNPHQRLLPDPEIKQAVKAALALEPHLAESALQVKVEEGVVTLAGAVDRLQYRSKAAEIAYNTAGVWQVINQLDVRPESLATELDSWRLPDDETQLAQKIRRVLARDPLLEQHEITVTVSTSSVMLEGRVDRLSQARRAEELVGGLRGVTVVQNLLDTRQARTAVDRRQLLEAVDRELYWSPFVNAANVQAVADENGTVTLIGVVDSLRERRAATKNAYDGGALKVRNLLKVRSGPKGLRPGR